MAKIGLIDLLSSIRNLVLVSIAKIGNDENLGCVSEQQFRIPIKFLSSVGVCFRIYFLAFIVSL